MGWVHIDMIYMVIMTLETIENQTVIGANTLQIKKRLQLVTATS